MNIDRIKRQPICSVESCGGIVRRYGYCNKHYVRFLKYGDPVAGKTFAGEPEKFYQTILVHQGEECLIWPYGKSAQGYGLIHRGRVRGGVHRFVCEDIHGPPQAGMYAAHECGNGHLGCVNPKHLSWKTPKENQADRLAHGTKLFGEKIKFSKLSETQVREILLLTGSEPRVKTAKKYGVSYDAILKVQTRKSWTHISKEITT